MERVFEALIAAAQQHEQPTRGGVVISRSENPDASAHWPNITFADCI